MYPKTFKDLLKGNYPNNYIGQGNPFAKILIIAKECTNTDDLEYKELIADNFLDWQDQPSPEQIPNWFDCGFDWQQYHPLQPFKGQRMLIHRNNNHGTNATFYAYQKFINALLPPENRAARGEMLNFYDYCFITELSTKCKKYSGKREVSTAQSIKDRLLREDAILRQPFFQQFPIIILACFRYYDMYGIDIQTLFNTHFVPPTNEITKHEFINKHISSDGKRLLLHTNHFSMRSNAFIEALAAECKAFIKQQNISLTN